MLGSVLNPGGNRRGRARLRRAGRPRRPRAAAPRSRLRWVDRKRPSQTKPRSASRPRVERVAEGLDVDVGAARKTAITRRRSRCRVDEERLRHPRLAVRTPAAACCGGAGAPHPPVRLVELRDLALQQARLVRPAPPAADRPPLQIMRRVWPLPTVDEHTKSRLPMHRVGEQLVGARPAPTLTKATSARPQRVVAAGNIRWPPASMKWRSSHAGAASARRRGRRRRRARSSASLRALQPFSKRQIRQFGTASSNTRASPSSIASVIEPDSNNRRLSFTAEVALRKSRGG